MSVGAIALQLRLKQATGIRSYGGHNRIHLEDVGAARYSILMCFGIHNSALCIVFYINSHLFVKVSSQSEFLALTATVVRLSFMAKDYLL